jgi:hypothetical protein
MGFVSHVSNGEVMPSGWSLIVKRDWIGLLLMCALGRVIDVFAADFADITGRWEVATTYPGGSSVAGLDITLDEDQYKGKSGWLIPDYDVFIYAGSRDEAGVRLSITYPDGGEIGEIQKNVLRQISMSR